MLAVLANLFVFPFFALDLAGRAIGFSAAAFAEAASSGEAQTAALLIASLVRVPSPRL